MRLLRLAVVELTVVGCLSCVDEKIVYRDGPNFTQPPASAANFIGYADQTQAKTVCGSCHVTQDGKWKETAHAHAWSTLAANPGKQAFCEGCHTVSANGNVATGDVGWTGSHDTRFYDVQCESCHGPGLAHVTAPARGQMLASAIADTASTLTNGCSECHSGTHHPFVEEWRQSRHATSYTRGYNGSTATPPEIPGGPRAACQGCHIGQQVLNNWGVNTNYTEKNLGQTQNDGAFGVTCIVCHDPHGSGNAKQLRYPVDSRDPENNLCTKCHNRRGNPDFAGSRDTPHAPHGPLVFGTAGWWPPGVSFDETESSHGSEKNPRLCATCHVQNYPVTDEATGNFTVQVVGHRFLPIPCVDANGAPTEDQSCEEAQRSFRSCSASGCHTEASARTAFLTAEADIAFLASAAQQMIDQVPASEKLPAARGKVTTARGSQFNVNLALAVGSAAHNPFLVKALLRASMAQMAQEYGITPPIPLPRLAPYDKLITRRGN
jgi:predicted CXXCH cytochrome family protein